MNVEAEERKKCTAVALHCLYFAVNVETDEIYFVMITQRTVDIFYEVFSNIYEYISFSTLVDDVVCFAVTYCLYVVSCSVVAKNIPVKTREKCVFDSFFFFLM